MNIKIVEREILRYVELSKWDQFKGSGTLLTYPCQLVVGEAFHTALWKADFDPKGKKVAVIGTGASAVQV